jgi:hypothetical protein
VIGGREHYNYLQDKPETLDSVKITQVRHGWKRRDNGTGAKVFYEIMWRGPLRC